MTITVEQLFRQALADRYQVEGEVGRGGMATVLLAVDRKHGRKVAIKVLQPGLAALMGTERFRREIEIAANLNHPNILPLLDSGVAGDLPYYVMPFVEGESLRDLIEREGAMPVDRVLRFADQIGSALDAAHRRGLVHRDIKPENILLNEGQAVVTDFGIARPTGASNLTATGMSLGTPAYMSPEQAGGESSEVDGRSDQYSLACMIYELLTGHQPFRGGTVFEVIAKQVSAEVPAVAGTRGPLPPGLEPALARALAKTPAERFPTVGEFVRQLGAPTAPTPTRILAGRRPFPRKAIAIGAAVLLVAGAGWLLGRSIEARSSESGPIPLAVLPLELVGQGDRYFADGLADEIASRLTHVAGLAIIARNNTIRYRGTEKTIQQIGKELGVRYVLTGQVDAVEGPSGRRVRVRPELVRVADEQAAWGDSYIELVDDLFQVQGRIAQKVVDQLEIRLAEPERRAIKRAPTTDRQAYDLYTQGRFHWKKRTPDGLRLGASYFNQAIARDSNFARAWAGLADAYVLYSQFGVTDISRDSAYALARRAATRALAKDSTVAEAHASLAEVIMYSEWNWAEAERQFKAAIALDPTYATARQWYAELLAVTGRPGEALPQGIEAARLDPTSAVVVHAHAVALRALRRFDAAIPVYRRCLELDPSFGYAQFGLVLSWIGAGNRDSAFKQLDRMGLGSEVYRAWVGAAIDSSQGPAARRLVAASRAQVEALGAITAAMINTAVGDREAAIAGLTRIVDDRGTNLPPLEFAEFDRLRADPRFKRLVERIQFEPMVKAAAPR